MKRILLLILLVFCISTNLSATSLVPASYSSNFASGAYPDDTGNQLIDGLFQSLTPGVTLCVGTCYNWVGWDGYRNPSILFDFGQVVTVNSVSISMANWNPAGVDLPSQVKINSNTFNVTGSFTPTDKALLTFNGSWVGQTLSLDLTSTNYWTFIDEVSFDGQVGPTSVPEGGNPITYMALALTTLCVMTPRLRRQAQRR